MRSGFKKTNWLLLIMLCLILLGLGMTKMNEAGPERVLEAARMEGRQGMELVLRDARNHPRALVEANGRGLSIIDERGRRAVTYRREDGQLLRNGVAVVSNVSGVSFKRTDQVIEVELEINPGRGLPPVVLFAVAKPGMGNNGVKG